MDALVARGDLVTVIDNLSTGHESNLKHARASGAAFVNADIRDAGAVDGVFSRVSPSVVFHLAAQIDVRRSVIDPAHDADVNVLGTVNVLSAAYRYGARRVINTSTGGAIYGAADTIPTPEEAPARPLAAYGTSKLCGEQYCDWFRRLHGLSTVTLRLANVYGPRQDPLGEAGVVAIFCDQLLAGQAPTVFGTGAQTRDFVFVEDVVVAQLAAASATVEGIINIGTGKATTVLDLIGAVGRAGAEEGAPSMLAPTVFGEPREGEVEHSCLAIGRARDDLGFSASTQLVDGLRQTLQWVGGHRAQRGAGAAD
ncbi:MAG: NAD-dependent epimerase/dehydratase family protein [Solirubrobacteraceae bacterium]|nr:NAD-dependent epimerase/dehydratase family protein [Solirubrobacteraceae bacterium]